MISPYTKVSLALLFAALFLCRTASSKKNRNQPHPHPGILPSKIPGPFTDVELSAKDEAMLEKGQPVVQQTMPPKDNPDAGGSAVCIQDIAAPREAVWNQILGLEAYKGKVPKVQQCENYFEGKNEDGSHCVKTKMVIGVLPGYSYENYYDHSYYADNDSLTWKLDYDKTSDFDDVAGHWHVEEHPSKPNTSRVFYACDVMMKGNVPRPIMNYISKSALKSATGWVKKESEKLPDALIPAEFASKRDSAFQKQ